MNLRLIAPVALFIGLPASAQLPNPGTHEFESDFLGSSNEVYNDYSVRTLVEGWTGRRLPGGDLNTTPPFSEVAGGVLTYRGGQGDFSDGIHIDHQLTGAPANYLVQVKFRRDTAHSFERNDFALCVGDQRIWLGNGLNDQTGCQCAGPPFVIQTGTWYIVEVMQYGHPSPSAIKFDSSNYTAPQISVDWVFLDTAPMNPAPTNSYEMRVWRANQSRPVQPLASRPGPSMGTRYCDGSSNTIGYGAELFLLGSSVVSENNVSLAVGCCPSNVPGIFFFGPNQISAPFGEGIRCVGGTISRVQPTVTTGSDGNVTLPIDLESPALSGLITPGVTQNFQFWYRDTQGGPSGFNLSDAVSIDWQ